MEIFIAWTVLNRLEQNLSLKFIKNVWKLWLMSNNENKTVKYKHSQKSKKGPFVIYSNLECLLKKYKY